MMRGMIGMGTLHNIEEREDTLYHHGAVEVVKEHDVFSDNAGEEDETEGVTKDFDRFSYMLKGNESVAKLINSFIY